MSQQNFKFVFTLYFIVFGLVIAIFSSLIGYNIQLTNIQDRIDKSAEEIAFIKKVNTLKPDMEKFDTLLNALANNPELNQYIRLNNSQTKTHAQNVFLAIAMSDQLIMQARYLDENGMERIRIDRDNSSAAPYILSDNQLQDKSRRDYFQIVSTLKPQSVWHSKIDLNIEHGKVEVPYKPTLRLATPLYHQGKFKGIVIINILARDMIAKISKSTVFEHYIIDREGNFILHPDERFSWSKYTGSTIKLVDAFPIDASAILSKKTKGEEFYAFDLDDVLNNDDDARLILKPKQEYIDQLTITNIQTSILVIVLSILVSIPMAIYASLAPSKLQKALLASNNDLKRFADIIDRYVATVTTKTNTIVTSVSSAYAKLSGHNKEELIGQKINIVKHPDTPKEIYNDMWKNIANGMQWSGELKNRHKDGSIYWIDQTIIPIKNENDMITEYMSVGTDITAKKELETLSTTDQLTGIFNRRKLDEIISDTYNYAKRYGRDVCVMMIDIDYFKRVNDTYGHPVGDTTLKSVTALLSRNIRKSDRIGRFGGEEFMVICPETDENAALILAEKLRMLIDQHTFETLGNTTISIGVAQLRSEDTAEQWIERADKALYCAKQNGRNRVERG